MEKHGRSSRIENPPLLTRRQFIIGAAGVGATAGLVAVGIEIGSRTASEKNSDERDGRTGQGGVASLSTPDSQSGRTTETLSRSGDILPDSGLFTALSYEQQKEIMHAHAMTPKEFDALPPYYQVRYTDFLYRVYRPAATEAIKEELAKIDRSKRFSAPPDAMTMASTAQEILDDDAMKRFTAHYMAATGYAVGGAKMKRLWGINLYTDFYHPELKDPDNDLSLVDNYLPRGVLGVQYIGRGPSSRSLSIRSGTIDEGEVIFEQYDFVPFPDIYEKPSGFYPVRFVNKV